MEPKPCLADALSEEKLCVKPLSELENELVKSLSELVQLLKYQLQIESRRNDLLTDLLAHNQLVIDRFLAAVPTGENESLGSDPPEELEDEELIGLDGQPIRSDKLAQERSEET